jgi:hypothetical protein
MRGLVASAVLAVVLAAAPATARADALAVTLSVPSKLELHEPCRATVRVDRRVAGSVLLQLRRANGWRTVARARLRRRSLRLRCPDATRTGVWRMRALVRRGGRTLGRSSVRRLRLVAPAEEPPPQPPPAGQPPPDPPPGGQPLDPNQFGVEGTGGAPSLAALALLDNPQVRLTPAGEADLAQGRIDPRVVAVLSKLAETHAITVGTLSAGSTKFVSGGAVSMHWLGRAADVTAVDDVAVSPSNATAYGVAQSMSALHSALRPDEVGSPWSIALPGYFTDATTQDLLHIAFKQPIDPSWTLPAE